VSFILDTDICSAFLKGNPVVWQHCMLHTGQLSVSVITVAELFTWALRAKAPPKRLQKLLDFLADVPVLDITAEVARRFGELDAGMLDAGKRSPPMDLLIAATAILHNLTVVTHNVKDFSHVTGLTAVDWLNP
jgi:tRNA(fMet)-specific endonuclease VapC